MDVLRLFRDYWIWNGVLGGLEHNGHPIIHWPESQGLWSQDIVLPWIHLNEFIGSANTLVAHFLVYECILEIATTSNWQLNHICSLTSVVRAIYGRKGQGEFIELSIQYSLRNDRHECAPKIWRICTAYAKDRLVFRNDGRLSKFNH